MASPRKQDIFSPFGFRPETAARTPESAPCAVPALCRGPARTKNGSTGRRSLGSRGFVLHGHKGDVHRRGVFVVGARGRVDRPSDAAAQDDVAERRAGGNCRIPPKWETGTPCAVLLHGSCEQAAPAHDPTAVHARRGDPRCVRWRSCPRVGRQGYGVEGKAVEASTAIGSAATALPRRGTGHERSNSQLAAA